MMLQMDQHKAMGWKTPIWDEYKKIAADAEGKPVPFEEVERFAFYERAKKVRGADCASDERRRSLLSDESCSFNCAWLRTSPRFLCRHTPSLSLASRLSTPTSS